MSRRRRRGEEVSPAATGPSPDVAAARGVAPRRSHRWLFVTVLVAAPWILLILLELALRAVGFGVSMDYVLRQRVEGAPRYLSNPRFTWLFFDPGAARLLPPFSLPAPKAPRTCRIFVLGGSAAQGDPEAGFGIARMLGVLLRDQYPGVAFELVNSAPTAVNSHVVYAMAEAALDLEPDVLVVYSGNNEVVGPWGAGTVLTSSPPGLRVLRAGTALRATRLGQLAGRAVATVAGPRHQPPESWRGMQMFLNRQVRRTDPGLERTYRYYEQNLTDTCRLASRAGVPVVLSTLAVNLRSCGPFGSLHNPSLSPAELARWNALYEEGVGLAEGRPGEAAERFRLAAEIDGEHAELQFRRGQVAWRQSRFEEARSLFADALERDTLRFRADARINRIVRQVASAGARGGAHLADVAARFEERSPHGAPGEELFLDHVHFTFGGNYLVSVAILDSLRDALPEWVRKAASGRPLPDEAECGRRLVFTELDRYMIADTMRQRMQQPPFTAQVDHAEHLRRLTEEIEGLRARGESGGVEAAVAEYERAIGDERDHWSVRERYAAIEGRLGHPDVAEREWRRLAERFPQYPSFPLQWSRALRDLGRPAEAERQLGKVLAYHASAPILVEMAELVLLQGRPEEAVGFLEHALAVEPGMARAHEALGLLYQRLNERDKAIEHLTAALRAEPDRERARRALETLQGK